ncbi:hypothetical protein B1748_01405 [Paenibacillus sp. MY03]|uniref:hypothetical protein n=1 Tax=Paenibacillus sp. MY03 TaxID=302980 RepID=UPI000B3D3107|nr:hypothetical protein [Paenibacillus sp. MY03]OUS78760.1 hypothetical protein B1748_01405 [Paenibacillus sp. MY03]
MTTGRTYGWVKKYDASGEDALRDGRGRAKAPEELTEVDQQKLAMKKLEHENERLRQLERIQSVIVGRKRSG